MKITEESLNKDENSADESLTEVEARTPIISRSPAVPANTTIRQIPINLAPTSLISSNNIPTNYSGAPQNYIPIMPRGQFFTVDLPSQPVAPQINNTTITDVKPYLTINIDQATANKIIPLLLKVYHDDKKQIINNPALASFQSFYKDKKNTQKIINFLEKLALEDQINIIFAKNHKTSNLFTMAAINPQLFKWIIDNVFVKAANSLENYNLASNLEKREKYTLFKTTKISYTILKELLSADPNLEFYKILFSYCNSDNYIKKVIEPFKTYLLSKTKTNKVADKRTSITIIIDEANTIYIQNLLDILPNCFWKDQKWVDALVNIYHNITDQAKKDIIINILQRKKEEIGLTFEILPQSQNVLQSPTNYSGAAQNSLQADTQDHILSTSSLQIIPQTNNEVTNEIIFHLSCNNIDQETAIKIKNILLNISYNDRKKPLYSYNLETFQLFYKDKKNTKNVINFLEKLDLRSQIQIIFTNNINSSNLYTISATNPELFKWIVDNIFVNAVNSIHSHNLTTNLINYEKYLFYISNNDSFSVLNELSHTDPELKFYKILFSHINSNIYVQKVIEPFKTYLLSSPKTKKNSKSKNDQPIIHLLIDEASVEYIQGLLNLIPEYFWEDQNWINALENKRNNITDQNKKAAINEILQRKKEKRNRTILMPNFSSQQRDAGATYVPRINIPNTRLSFNPANNAPTNYSGNPSQHPSNYSITPKGYMVSQNNPPIAVGPKANAPISRLPGQRIFVQSHNQSSIQPSIRGGNVYITQLISDNNLNKETAIEVRDLLLNIQNLPENVPHLQAFNKFSEFTSNAYFIINFLDKLDLQDQIKVIFKRYNSICSLFTNSTYIPKLFKWIVDNVFVKASNSAEANILSNHLANVNQYPAKHGALLLKFLFSIDKNLDFYKILFSHSNEPNYVNNVINPFKVYLMSPVTIIKANGLEKIPVKYDYTIQYLIEVADTKYLQDLFNILPNCFWEDQNWVNTLVNKCNNITDQNKKIAVNTIIEQKKKEINKSVQTINSNIPSKNIEENLVIDLEAHSPTSNVLSNNNPVEMNSTQEKEQENDILNANTKINNNVHNKTSRIIINEEESEKGSGSETEPLTNEESSDNEEELILNLSINQNTNLASHTARPAFLPTQDLVVDNNYSRTQLQVQNNSSVVSQNINTVKTSEEISAVNIYQLLSGELSKEIAVEIKNMLLECSKNNKKKMPLLIVFNKFYKNKENTEKLISFLEKLELSDQIKIIFISNGNSNTLFTTSVINFPLFKWIVNEIVAKAANDETHAEFLYTNLRKIRNYNIYIKNTPLSLLKELTEVDKELNFYKILFHHIRSDKYVKNVIEPFKKYLLTPVNKVRGKEGKGALKQPITIKVIIDAADISYIQNLLNLLPECFWRDPNWYKTLKEINISLSDQDKKAAINAILQRKKEELKIEIPDLMIVDEGEQITEMVAPVRQRQKVNKPMTIEEREAALATASFAINNTAKTKISEQPEQNSKTFSSYMDSLLEQTLDLVNYYLYVRLCTLLVLMANGKSVVIPAFHKKNTESTSSVIEIPDDEDIQVINSNALPTQNNIVSNRARIEISRGVEHNIEEEKSGEERPNKRSKLNDGSSQAKK
ncbi:MAG: hypothetical protein J0H68_03915 [Sphingobacteriia bacterium]|nr:hypothetical protein [Sphingobacteriia bacterium]